MVGNTKISTQGVTSRGQLFACTRSKMETALEATQRPSGHLSILTLLVTMRQCCLTCLATVAFQAKKQERIYTGAVSLDLALVEAVLEVT